MNNREIKFRVWDKSRNFFIIPWCGPDYDDIDLLYTNSGKWYVLGGEKMMEDKYCMQQYIGVRDIDGKEIYDGDIVSGMEWFSARQPAWLPMENREIKNGALSEYGGRQYKDLVVVGNIFENPELLTN